MRQASLGCLIAHQTRRAIKVLAKVKFTISQTTPRTAIQLSRAITMIIYQTSRWPTSSMKVNTAATVRLGSRSGLIKSTMRQNHLRSVFAFKRHSSRLCSWSNRPTSSFLILFSHPHRAAGLPGACERAMALLETNTIQPDECLLFYYHLSQSKGGICWTHFGTNVPALPGFW